MQSLFLWVLIAYFLKSAILVLFMRWENMQYRKDYRELGESYIALMKDYRFLVENHNKTITSDDIFREANKTVFFKKSRNTDKGEQ